MRRILIAALLLPAFASAAGFDCARAPTAVEKRICADPELSALDEHMARYYAAAREVLGEGAACLQSGQLAWLRQRNACKDESCLKGAYLDRLAELDGLQPGATAIKAAILPRRPALVWVIAPADDKVAAPANPKAVPGEVSGTIVDEVATGDGFVVRAANGERRLLAMSMFLEPATATRLEALAREEDAAFTVRGHVAADGARMFFEPGRCTFIHRVPSTPAEGRVYPDPAQPRAGFKPHELAFATPRDGVARAEYRSVTFHAVILRTATACSIKEVERVAVQALFPSNKVFSTRFGCEDSVEEHVTYTNVDPKWGFLAVYAGATEAEARAFLKKVHATGRFPGANIRRMQAVLVSP